MRVKFSKDVTFTPEWNGNKSLPAPEQMHTVLAPMEFDDVMSIMDAMGGEETRRAVETEGVDAIRDRINFTKVIQENAGALRKYVKSITGLKGEDGEIGLDEIVRYPAFLGLAIELTMKLVEISMPSEEAEGNSEGQSVSAA